MTECVICGKEATDYIQLNYSIYLCDKHRNLVYDIVERVVDAFEHSREESDRLTNNNESKSQ